jgi:ABC-type glycerol-3-phosphate transport system substrate-binding protein
MNTGSLGRKLANTLVLVTVLLSVGCGPAATGQTESPAPVETQGVSPTEPPAGALPPVTIELYLPYISDEANADFNAQLEEFKAMEPNVVVNVQYLSPNDLTTLLVTKVEAGAPPTMAAVAYNGVAQFAQSGYLVPLDESPDFWGAYLDGAVQDSSVNGTIYGFPWQRYSCSPSYLSLVIFQTDSAELIAAAQSLGEFLTNEQNQQSNLDNDLYPTLKSFYDSSVSCDPVEEISLDPELVPQAVGISLEASEILSSTYDVQLDPYSATGLDAAEVQGEPGNIASTLAPAADANQYYGDYQVIGALTLGDDAAGNLAGLPVGAYLIACLPGQTVCQALPAQGEPIMIDPGLVSVGELPVPVQFDVVAFEQGTITKCFYILNVRYCISLF